MISENKLLVFRALRKAGAEWRFLMWGGIWFQRLGPQTAYETTPAQQYAHGRGVMRVLLALGRRHRPNDCATLCRSRCMRSSRWLMVLTVGSSPRIARAKPSWPPPSVPLISSAIRHVARVLWRRVRRDLGAARDVCHSDSLCTRQKHGRFTVLHYTCYTSTRFLVPGPSSLYRVFKWEDSHPVSHRNR